MLRKSFEEYFDKNRIKFKHKIGSKEFKFKSDLFQKISIFFSNIKYTRVLTYGKFSLSLHYWNRNDSFSKIINSTYILQIDICNKEALLTTSKFGFDIKEIILTKFFSFWNGCFTTTCVVAAAMRWCKKNNKAKWN